MLGPTFTCSVVVVDDDHHARRRLAAGLAARGYGVSDAATGIAGVEQALTEACDVVVVTVPLPDMHHRQFVSMIRAVGDVTVIALQRDREGVAGLLGDGADDATSGRSVDEVDARIRSALRRGAAPSGLRPVTVGSLHIDPAAREVSLDGRPLELSRMEFDLLLTLAQDAGTVISKDRLLAEVWQRPDGNGKTVDVHLSWLRRKLGETAAEPHYLRTVRGVGVKLVDPGA